MTINTQREALYLDDIRVGQKFGSDSHTLDEAQIKAFAAQFDPQPFHLDEAAARDSLFGGLAASGWHTASITMRLLVTSGAPMAGGVIGAGCEISWPIPTRPERGIVTILSQTRNQHGEVVQLMTAKLVVFRRPVASATSK